MYWLSVLCVEINNKINDIVILFIIFFFFFKISYVFVLS